MPHLRCRPRTTAFGVSTLLAAVVGAGLSLPAHAVQVGNLVPITGATSPFRNCTADQVNSQDGENYLAAVVEPWIAANPASPTKLLTGWQQDRWSNGGSRGLLAGISGNAGASWSTKVPGKVTKCEGGPYARASDPWVDFSPNGVAYFMHLAFQEDLPSGGFGPNAMLVARSTDNGATWGNPITLRRDTNPQILNDKNSLTADPNNSRYVYAIWDRLQDYTLSGHAGDEGGEGKAAATASGGDGVQVARANVKRLRSMAQGRAAGPAEVFFRGPTWFARTTNGGTSWQTAKKIYDPGPNAQTINNIIVVPPSGTLLDFFTHILPNGGTRIDLIRSFDKGSTFRAPIPVATIATVNGVVTPDTQDPVRDASILFDVAVDPSNGNLYVVWQDVRFRGIDEVAFSMSTNGGTSWSDPVRINRTPNNRNPLRQQAFVPSIAVGPNGGLTVTYYDFRNDTADSHEATDYWAVFCSPQTLDCRKPSNWGIEVRLTNSSFDIQNAPFAGGYFLGDYMGLTRAGAAVHAAFVAATTPGKTVLYSRKITF